MLYRVQRFPETLDVEGCLAVEDIRERTKLTGRVRREVPSGTGGAHEDLSTKKSLDSLEGKGGRKR